MKAAKENWTEGYCWTIEKGIEWVIAERPTKY